MCASYRSLRMSAHAAACSRRRSRALASRDTRLHGTRLGQFRQVLQQSCSKSRIRAHPGELGNSRGHRTHRLLTGAFASNAINSTAHGWLIDGNFGQMLIQIYDILGTFIWCGVVTYIILKVIDATIGLRVTKEVEIEGLDINLHGEVVQ